MDVIDTDFYQPTPKEAQVWKVCDELLAQKKRITYQSIGEHLLKQGLKRGSNTDICRYLSSWKKHHYPATVARKTASASSFKALKPAKAFTQEHSLVSIESQLEKLVQNQQTLLDLLSGQPNTQTEKASSAKDQNQHVQWLLDIIQKQSAREIQYLNALEHARSIQTLLKQEIEKYRLEIRTLEAALTVIEVEQQEVEHVALEEDF